MDAARLLKAVQTPAQYHLTLRAQEPSDEDNAVANPKHYGLCTTPGTELSHD